jgi:undecaprenyl diphosphate synthase
MSDSSAAEPARYVAIITDGNGRWAASRGLPTIEGHRAGADTVKARLRDAVELGVRELKSEGEVGADDEKRAETELQKLTDGRIADLDEALKAKEAEILEV